MAVVFGVRASRGLCRPQNGLECIPILAATLILGVECQGERV